MCSPGPATSFPDPASPGLAGHGGEARVLHPLVWILPLLGWLGTRGAVQVLHPFALHTPGQLGVRCTLVLHLQGWLDMGVQSGSCTPLPGSCTPKVAGHEDAAWVLHYFFSDWLGMGMAACILHPLARILHP